MLAVEANTALFLASYTTKFRDAIEAAWLWRESRGAQIVWDNRVVMWQERQDMAILATHQKQPWEVKDYDIDYSDWLNGVSPADTLASVVAIVTNITTPADTALVVNSVTVSTTKVKFMVSGGTAGDTYKLTARATTNGVDGFVRKDESELRFVVKDV